MQIRELLTQQALALTPSEAKIVQSLLADYPVAGLSTAASLAQRADVSIPTVIRLVTKLGFDGFPAFQARLLAEVDAGLRSPLMMMKAKRPSAKGRGVAQTYLISAAAAVENAANMAVPQVFERAARLIMDAKGRVLLIGGRFSRYVSGMLAAYLAQFRPGVESIAPLNPESLDLLVDLGSRDTLIAFDYRRYQTDVIRFAEQAHARDVPIVLFTDPWRSPIADLAKAVLICSGEAGSPYDSLAPAVAQMEALLAHIVAQKSRAQNERVGEIESVRHDNAVTVERTDEAGAGARG